MVLDLILDAFTDDSSTGARSCSTPHAADVVKFNVNLQVAPFDLDLITLPTRLSQRWGFFGSLVPLGLANQFNISIILNETRCPGAHRHQATTEFLSVLLGIVFSRPG